MKKNLILAACLGLVSVGAFAQSSVTIYGVVDAGITATKQSRYHWDTQSMTKQWRTGVDSGNLSASRIGIKGVEDLGGGTSAIFNLEAGFNIDNGNSAGAYSDFYSKPLFGRRAIVGLKNDHYGELTLGRQDTVMGDAMKLIDPFADAYQYSTSAFIMYDVLMANSLAYTTPKWHGLSAKLNYAFGENMDTVKKGNYYSASLNYNADKLNMALAYSHANYAMNKNTYLLGSEESTYGVVDNYIALYAVPPDTRKQLMLAASYDFGMVKPFAVLTTAKNVIQDYEYDMTVFSKEKTAEVGMTLPFGANSIIGSVGYTNVHLAYPIYDEVKLDAWNYKIGYTYDFSKRTTVYTLLNYVKNRYYQNPTFFTQHNGYAEFSLGIRHRF